MANKPIIKGPGTTKRQDDTLVYGTRQERPFQSRREAGPLQERKSDGIMDCVCVYRLRGQLRDFATADPEDRRILLGVMQNLRKRLEENPGYTGELQRKRAIAERLKLIPDGPLLQRLAICVAVWALENSKIRHPSETRAAVEKRTPAQEPAHVDDEVSAEFGEPAVLVFEPVKAADPREFGNGTKTPIIESWETAYCFIKKRGVGKAVVTPVCDEGNGVAFAVTELEKFRVVPKPGVTEGQLKIFFKNALAGKDYSKPEVMFEAAMAAAAAGLVDIRNRQTKEVPAIKIKDPNR